MEDSKLNRRTFLYQSLVTSTTAISSRRIFGANDRISIGMIGCGTRNLLKEVLQFSQDTNVEVTAVCDTWRQQREKAVAMVKEGSGNEPQQYVHYQDLLAIKEEEIGNARRDQPIKKVLPGRFGEIIDGQAITREAEALLSASGLGSAPRSLH